MKIKKAKILSHHCLIDVIVECPYCQRKNQYKIPDEEFIPDDTVKERCYKCGKTIIIDTSEE